MLAALCAKMTSTSSYLVSPSLISLPMHCSWDSLTDTIICYSHYTSSVKNQCLPILPTHKIQASLRSSQNLIILFSSNFITHYPLTRSPHLQPNPFSHAMSSPASAPLPCRHPWNILFPFPIQIPPHHSKCLPGLYVLAPLNNHFFSLSSTKQ